MGEDLVVGGSLVPGQTAPQYCWAARFH
jgi:hypothetical protein